MGIFSNLSTENIETQKDSTGGFSLLESGIYPATIKAVYVTQSKSGAAAANLVYDVNGQEHREQIWVTNSKGENFYINEKTKNKIALPGFTTMNDICICACNSELKDMDTPNKVFKIYDFESKSEVAKEVPTLVDLAGKQVLLGVIKQIVDKRVKDANGNYVASGETREENVIDKVFHGTKKLTVNEAKSGITEPGFYDKWLARNEGKTRNKAKGKQETAPMAGAPKKPTSSLFS